MRKVIIIAGVNDKPDTPTSRTLPLRRASLIYASTLGKSAVKWTASISDIKCN